jgi:hypothetical protein
MYSLLPQAFNPYVGLPRADATFRVPRPAAPSLPTVRVPPLTPARLALVTGGCRGEGAEGANFQTLGKAVLGLARVANLNTDIITRTLVQILSNHASPPEFPA